MSDARFEGFPRRGGSLYAEEVPIAEIVAQVGTPTYIYSAGALAAAHDSIAAGFAGCRYRICYSIKSNMNLAVVRTLVARGAGVDVTSRGELFRALRAGAEPKSIVYSGVGKRDDEIQAALETGIKQFNVESRAELRHIDAVARRLDVRAPITFRVNPDVDPKTHPYISTGLRTSKFGIPIGEAVAAYAEAKALPNIDVVGVDCHIGSQLVSIEPFADAPSHGMRVDALEFRNVLEVVADLHLPVQPALFGQVADAVLVVERIAAEHLDRTAVGIDDGHDHPERGRLARPVGSNEAAQASLGHVQIEFADRVRAAERLTDAANGNGRVCHDDAGRLAWLIPARET